MKVKCPRCKVETEYDKANSFRPFCSDRCQLIDLGAWAEGSYKIPTQESAEVSIDTKEDSEEESDENLH